MSATLNDMTVEQLDDLATRARATAQQKRDVAKAQADAAAKAAKDRIPILVRLPKKGANCGGGL